MSTSGTGTLTHVKQSLKWSLAGGNVMFSNFILSLLSLVSPNGQFAVQLEDLAGCMYLKRN